MVMGRSIMFGMVMLELNFATCRMDSKTFSGYTRPVMRRIPGNSLKLGSVPGMVAPLEMTPEQRSTHLYVCGATGTGKSKMLESLVRQDIKNWHKTKYGALIIEPHGRRDR